MGSRGPAGLAGARAGRATERYLGAVVDRLSGALGSKLVGVYLVGSGALGDWLAGSSDVDVLAVCAERLAREEAERVVAPLWHAALPCRARGLELVA